MSATTLKVKIKTENAYGDLKMNMNQLRYSVVKKGKGDA